MRIRVEGRDSRILTTQNDREAQLNVTGEEHSENFGQETGKKKEKDEEIVGREKEKPNHNESTGNEATCGLP